WYDNLLHEGFKLFRGWTTQARSPEARRLTKLLVGPWTHSGLGSAELFGDISFGPGAAVDLIGEHLRWYDCRLRGTDTGIESAPPVPLFEMSANVWRSENEWPPAPMKSRHAYLHSRGRANSHFGDGRLNFRPPTDEPVDRFMYDPHDPVPTHGGQSLFAE